MLHLPNLKNLQLRKAATAVQCSFAGQPTTATKKTKIRSYFRRAQPLSSLTEGRRIAPSAPVLSSISSISHKCIYALQQRQTITALKMHRVYKGNHYQIFTIGRFTLANLGRTWARPRSICTGLTSVSM